MTKRESITSFYDSIANKYDSQLTENDKRAREEISVIFTSNIAHGWVLDFGSGTGLDLPWLLSSGYDVIAFEPSVMMRNIAINKFSKEKIHFVGENFDFELWSPSHLPFNKKVDGILANFAVVNCIKNCSEFFEKMALVSSPNSFVLITIINPLFMAVMANYSIFVALRLFCFGSFTILNNNNRIYHETHLHTISAIQKASQKYFGIKSIKPISSSNFITITLSRK